MVRGYARNGWSGDIGHEIAWEMVCVLKGKKGSETISSTFGVLGFFFRAILHVMTSDVSRFLSKSILYNSQHSRNCSIPL